MYLNALGIKNVLTGQAPNTSGAYTSAGTSVLALVEKLDSKLAADLKSRLDLSIQLADQIPVPFDQALVTADGRAKILAVIESLEAQATLIKQAGNKLGVEVDVNLPQ
jgi:uncharacterized iron-regulated protein